MRPGPRRLPRGPSGAPPPDFTPSVNLSRAFDLAGRRDSDVSSLCSSLPSSAGGRRSLVANSFLSDRSSQSSALSYVNSYLSSVNAGFSLRPPLPSAKDIISALRFLLSRLEFPIPPSDKALEEELLTFLRLLNCPCKLTRSALKAPGTPHAWPPILSVLYWLTQLASVHDHSSELAPSNPPNDFDSYLTQSYDIFLSGDDDTVKDFDKEYALKVRAHAVTSVEHNEGLDKEAMDLEARLSAMTQEPSAREEFETKRALLMEDRRKFEAVVQSWTGRVREMEETLAGLQRELEEKEKETKRYVEERRELEKRIREQGVNVRDVERMRREMQSVERDIEEAINGKNLMEEKSWEIEAGIVKKLDELELLVEQCNNTFRKLKLEVDFEYVLNANGSSPSEVIGENYKTTLKPALKSLDEDFKKSSVSTLEESIAFRKELQEKSELTEEKKKHFTNLQNNLNQIESQLALVKNELEKNRSKFAAETDKLKAEMKQKENELTIAENQAKEYLKNCEKKKEDAYRESEEEIQMSSRDLLALIDSISEEKEFVESTVAKLQSDFSELLDDVAGKAKYLVSSSVLGVKRARPCVSS